MSNMITGFIGVAVFAVFLSDYAIRINSVPLWIIILSVLAMVGYDYVSSLRRRGGDDKS